MIFLAVLFAAVFWTYNVFLMGFKLHIVPFKKVFFSYAKIEQILD